MGPTLEVGTTLGRYRLIEELARGAMGKVYKGHDPALDRPVALKVMTTTLATSPEEEAEFRARFEREARIAASLRHPNIVQVHDAGADLEQGLLFIAMEYIEGETLRDVLERDGRLPKERAVAIGAAVAEALRFAHSASVIHRDVKPSNILLGLDGEVKLTDFGIARVPLSDLTRTGVHVGTPNFMSPEQVKGRTADARSDLFSLGVALYWMLTGQRPFGDDDPARVAYRTVNVLPVPPHEIDPSIDVQLSRIVLAVLEKDPAKRTQTAAELGRALADLRASADDAPPLPPPPAPTPAPIASVAAVPSPAPAAEPPSAREPGPLDTVAIPRPSAPAKTASRLPLLVGGVALGAFLLGALLATAIVAGRRAAAPAPPPTAARDSQQEELARAWDLGVDYYRAGKLSEAAEKFELILSRRPDHADALRYLALVQEDMSRTAATVGTPPGDAPPTDPVGEDPGTSPPQAATVTDPGSATVPPGETAPQDTALSPTPTPLASATSPLPPLPSPRPTPSPALESTIQVELSHRLEQGTLEIRVDGKSSGQVTFEGKDRAFVGVRGEMQTTFRVPSGSHQITFVVGGRRKDQAVRQERSLASMELPAGGSVRVNVEMDRAGNLDLEVAP